MKIKYAIHGCNSNLAYLNYWPHIAAAWQRLGIAPVLFYIQDDPDILPASGHGIVHTFAPLAYSVVMQTLWVRFWGAAKFYADDIVVTSDMDMLPLSRWYFVDQLRQYDDSLYVYLNRRYTGHPPLTVETIECEYVKRLQACYNIAKGSTMREILELSNEWEESLSIVAPYFTLNRSNGFLWNGDEIFVTNKVQDYADQSRIILLDIQKNLPPALSRTKLRQYPFYDDIYQYQDIRCDSFYCYDIDLIEKGYYIDAHLHIEFSRGKEIAASILGRREVPRQYIHTIRKCLALIRSHRRWGASILLGYPLFLFLLYMICHSAMRRYSSIPYFKCIRKVQVILFRRLLDPIYKWKLLKNVLEKLVKYLIAIKNHYNLIFFQKIDRKKYENKICTSWM